MKRNQREALLFAGFILVPLTAGAARAGVPWPTEPRTIDGTANNLAYSEWGSAGTQLLRVTEVSYADGVSTPAGPERPSARLVSNSVCAQTELIPNPANATDFIWQWGQFIDHDTTLVDPADPLEPFDIPVPVGDEFFDPDHDGDAWILLDRSRWDPATGTDLDNPREQIEEITAYIDGSQVYGSDAVRAAALRTNDGTGRLETSAGDLLPFNVDGLPNLGGPDPALFLAGDIRANEQIGLTSMHTLWMREHNRLADRIRAEFPDAGGDAVYEAARALVGAEIQVITYKEFLPVLIGPDAIPSYAGYDAYLDAGIANVFASAYRVGHTLLSPQILRIDASGRMSPYGPVPLRDAFFAIDLIIEEGGIAPILRGLATQTAQNVDPFVIDDLRNFLFGQPGEGGFDLVSLNIQRGRDHGLASYNQARIDFELPPAQNFSDISSVPEIAQSLKDAYGDVNAVDLWVGAISEDHVDGALVGRLLREIIGDQFRRLRDGDRFWYQNVFSGQQLAAIESVRLSDVIRWNTEIGDEIQDEVFLRAARCAGDVNGDGEVSVTDILVVLEGWDQLDHEGDVNGDGVVDAQDLLIVIAAWGPCSE